MSTVGSSNSIVYGSDKAGAVSVNGGRGRSNNFSVNGGDANDQFVNLPTVQPSPDSIEEFRVLTNTFDAEYGRNSGSIVNVITKSGTNAIPRQCVRVFPQHGAQCESLLLLCRWVCPSRNSTRISLAEHLADPIKKDRSSSSFPMKAGAFGRDSVAGVTVPTAAERPVQLSHSPIFPRSHLSAGT